MTLRSCYKGSRRKEKLVVELILRGIIIDKLTVEIYHLINCVLFDTEKGLNGTFLWKVHAWYW
jgi:hypothetical protein